MIELELSCSAGVLQAMSVPSWTCVLAILECWEYTPESCNVPLPTLIKPAGLARTTPPRAVLPVSTRTVPLAMVSTSLAPPRTAVPSRSSSELAEPLPLSQTSPAPCGTITSSARVGTLLVDQLAASL